MRERAKGEELCRYAVSIFLINLLNSISDIALCSSFNFLYAEGLILYFCLKAFEKTDKDS